MQRLVLRLADILAPPTVVLVLPALFWLFSGQSEFLRMDQFTHIYKGEHIAQTSEEKHTNVFMQS